MKTQYDLPYGSVLSSPPSLDFARPCAFFTKYTKLFLVFSMFLAFAEFAFAQDYRVHGLPHRERLAEPGYEDTKSASGDAPEGMDEASTPSSDDQSSKTASDVSEGSVRVNPRASSDTPTSEQAIHLENMLNGIAQDIFHHPMEANFYESRWQEALKDWAKDETVLRNFAELRKEKPDLSLYSFYAIDNLNWHGMDCSLKLHGCTKVPTPEWIRRQFPTDHHRARQVSYAIDSFRKLNVEQRAYNRALISAQLRMTAYCEEFSKIFFHKATKGKKKNCPKKLMAIIFGIIMALLAIITLGHAAYTMLPAMATALVSSSMSSLVAGGAVPALEAGALVGAQTAAEVGIETGVEVAVEVAGEVASEVAIAAGSTEMLGEVGGLAATVSEASLEGFEIAGSASSLSVVSDAESAGATAAWIAREAFIRDMFYGLISPRMTDTSLLEDVVWTIQGYVEELYNMGPSWMDAAMLRIDDVDAFIWRTESAFLDTPAGLMATSSTESPSLQDPPSWFGYNFTQDSLKTMSVRAAMLTKYLVDDIDALVIECTRRKLSEKITAQAPGVNGAGLEVPRAQLFRKAVKWMADFMVDSLLSSRGTVLGYTDLSTYVKTYKKAAGQEKLAVQRSMRTAMSAFTREKNHTSPLPKAWGAFGHLESFGLADLAFDRGGDQSIYGQTEVKSTMVFKRYPEGPHDTISQNATGSGSADMRAIRLTKLFTMYESKAAANFSAPRVDSLASLGPRIALRMQDEDGKAMGFEQAMDFWELHASNIDQRVQTLRNSSSASNVAGNDVLRYVPIKKPRTPLKIGVTTALDTLPWTSVLGNVKLSTFSSTGATDSQVPELRWQATASARLAARLGKREAHQSLQRVAVHDIRGAINHLQSLGFIEQSAAGEHKQFQADPPIETRRNEHGDYFVAKIDGRMFKNEIHREICGQDNYTGKTKDNEEACFKFLKKVTDAIVKNMATPSDFRDASLATFANTIGKRYSSYQMFIGADSEVFRRKPLEEKLFQNFKNSLVSKAYSDQNCYLKCHPAPPNTTEHPREIIFDGPDGKQVVCLTGCFDSIKGGFEQLYGLEWKYGEPATKGIWKLDAANISKVSWEAYKNRDMTGFLPGRIDLNPYLDQIKDHSPILPVCFSEIEPEFYDVKGLPISGQMCSCGDKWGSETGMMLGASNWQGGSRKEEEASLLSCLFRLTPLSKTSPAAFLVNMCNVFFKEVAPPGGHSYQEEHHKGHYAWNHHMCRRVWNTYERYKGNEHDLEVQVCEQWKWFAKDMHKNGRHVDFSFVNNLIDNTGCGGLYEADH